MLCFAVLLSWEYSAQLSETVEPKVHSDFDKGFPDRDICGGTKSQGPRQGQKKGCSQPCM